MILNRQNLYKAQQFLNYMYFNIRYIIVMEWNSNLLAY